MLRYTNKKGRKGSRLVRIWDGRKRCEASSGAASTSTGTRESVPVRIAAVAAALEAPDAILLRLVGLQPQHRGQLLL